MTENFASRFFGTAIFLQQAFLTIILAGSITDHIIRADRRFTVSTGLLGRAKRQSYRTNIGVPFVVINKVGLLKATVAAFGFIDDGNMWQDAFLIYKPVEVLC